MYYDCGENLTQFSHFMYFNLLGELSCRVDNKNDAFKNATLVHTKGTMSFFKQGNCWGVNDTPGTV